MPKVSVIIPVFNCEAYIEECIQSVTAQSEGDLEIIVVDDSSTDCTPAILRRLASADERIAIYHQPHSGRPGVARNVALSHATGHYLAFLDGDDLYHPDKIERALSVSEAFPEVDIVFHDLKRFRTQLDEECGFLENSHFLLRAARYLTDVGNKTYMCQKGLYVFASVHMNPFHTSSMMLRRDLLASPASWFREDVRSGEDGDLWFRLVKNGRVAFLNEVLSYYRQRPGSITSDLEQCLPEVIKLHNENLERGMDVFSKQDVQMYRSKIAQQLFDLGHVCFCNQKPRESRSAYRRSMGIEFSAKTLMAYLKTFLPDRT